MRNKIRRNETVRNKWELKQGEMKPWEINKERNKNE